MTFSDPWYFLIGIPAAILVWWLVRTSHHPMSLMRRRITLALRLLTIFIVLAILAGPAWQGHGRGRAVVFIVDHSQSLGADGGTVALNRMQELARELPSDTAIAIISAGSEPVVRRMPIPGQLNDIAPDPKLSDSNGDHSDLAAALDIGRGLFPAYGSRQVVLISDGMQTRGDLLTTARECALANIPVIVAPVSGPARPDVRIARLVASRVRAHEGAAITLTAEVEASMVASGRLRLFENGVEVAVRNVDVKVGSMQRIEFQRVPAERNLYTYRVVTDGFTGDQIPANNEALALVDVAGRPRLLHVVGDDQEAHYLSEALTQEGMRIDRRTPTEMPATPQELSAYDGIILSDVPARLLTDAAMDALKAYVEEFGGGLVVAGGTNSYGVGGYFRTPLEELLPVKMQSQDTEEKASVALALVIDRSGSMSGEKLEVCKSAAVATAQLLQSKDYLGVVVFDSTADWAVPMARLNSKADVQNRIATIAAGGGTNIWPGMSEARTALSRTPAKMKHMIVLTDGQSSGSGYPQLAAACRTEKITVSTVAVGGDADAGLLQTMAAAGGGKFYLSQDPSQVPRIFTQDAMTHLGKLVREQAFTPRQVERHPMLAGWDISQAPNLLGYVRTLRRTTSQIPLVTDLGDPLLAHWRFGTGKVSAFTSDCTSRWSGLWLARWPQGFSQLWVQIVRETIREPQGRRLDLKLDEHGSITHIQADLREDADTWKDGAQVQADVFHVPPRGGELRPVIGVSLQQDGPGRYRGSFRPSEHGVYLVRARSGGDTVSAGLVHNPGSEVASGTVDSALLGEVARLTGGSVLDAQKNDLPEPPPPADSLIDLRPFLLMLTLLVFLCELTVRRWENALGIWERIRGKS